MNATKRWTKIAGLVLHVLIGGLMIFAGSGKLFGFAQQPIDELGKAGLGSWIPVIAAGEIITAVLLLIPRTSSLGILLTSSFWGGAICLHMSKGELFIPQSVFLLLAWVGTYLRNPATFSSFFGSPAVTQKVAEPSEPVLS
jgi:hypothetical protein